MQGFWCTIVVMNVHRSIVLLSLEVHSSYQAVPLGAACVVSSLKNDPVVSASAEISLFSASLEDERFQSCSASQTAAILYEDIALSYPNIVLPNSIIGFSLYVWNRNVFEELAKIIRAKLPSAIIFAGGPETTADPSLVLSFCDYSVCGEGELSTRTLLSNLLAGTKVENRIITSSSPDCLTLSSPYLDGVLLNTKAVSFYHGALWELARGCPFSCTYCYESKGSKKVRAFPIEKLEKELAYFVSNGIERVFVLDPTYNATKERALSILDLIYKKGGDIHFNFEVRSELLDRELVEAFSKIPCSLQIGLQSSNPEVLQAVKRPSDMKQFAKKISLLNEYGIVFGLDIMYGLPKDSLSTFRTSLDYAISLYPNNIEIFRLAVLPGTVLFEEAASLKLSHLEKPPYTVTSTPTFSQAELLRADAIARACDIFYTQGRAVTWFISVLQTLKLKSSQFFQDFADFLVEENSTISDIHSVSHKEIEVLQLSFLEKKTAQKNKAFLFQAIRDCVRLNGAWTRAFAEGEETTVDLCWHPEDIFSSDMMDIEYFVENVCMEQCSVRVFQGPTQSPEIEIL